MQKNIRFYTAYHFLAGAESDGSLSLLSGNQKAASGDQRIEDAAGADRASREVPGHLQDQKGQIQENAAVQLLNRPRQIQNKISRCLNFNTENKGREKN